jgi:hypothetical protein
LKDYIADTTNTYAGDNSFTIGEWTYCSISVFKANRIYDTYTINIATKTKLLSTHSKQFTGQDLNLECKSEAQSSITNNIIIGNVLNETKSEFTGYLNLFMMYKEPQSLLEMLSNSHRCPIKYSNVYEPKLKIALIVLNSTESPDTNKVYDFTSDTKSITLDSNATTVKLEDFSSDTINI